MEIGVPKETKNQEFRVGLSPSSMRVLSENGHLDYLVLPYQTGEIAGSAGITPKVWFVRSKGAFALEK